MDLIIISLGITLAIQVLFFIYAAIKKTDTVTDLSYGLTFVIVAWVVSFATGPNIPKYILLALVTLWGVRLAGFLFMRIRKWKKDNRFDGIREDFWKFARFWILQGISVWIIMLPVSTYAGKTPAEAMLPQWFLIFPVIALAGIVIEAVADWQKYKFKENPANKEKWIATGLWKYSRHPNYFGEILMWVGVFGTVAASLVGWEWLAIISPLYIATLLLFVTGVPTVEKKNDERYGKDPEYVKYKKSSGLIFPRLG